MLKLLHFRQKVVEINTDFLKINAAGKYIDFVTEKTNSTEERRRTREDDKFFFIFVTFSDSAPKNRASYVNTEKS